MPNAIDRNAGDDRVRRNFQRIADMLGGGTSIVSSVGLSMPGIFAVAGSPVTSSGTLSVTLATQAANTVFAGPTSGAAATPTFRALVTNDLADGLVTGVKLADGAVGASKLSVLTTKGDLLVYTSQHARLAVGSDGQVLTADSTQAAGVKWATPASGGAEQLDVLVPVVGEVPSGSINGTNNTFTLSRTPDAASEAVYVNGLRQTRGVDYTVSVASVVFTASSVPQTNDTVLVDYFYHENPSLTDDGGTALTDDSLAELLGA